MTGDSGFAVQAQSILNHATTVDVVAAQVAQARSAAGAVHMGRHAYGILCQPIPTLLDPIQEAVVTALGETSDSLQRSAEDLRVTARDYKGSDERTANTFRGGYE